MAIQPYSDITKAYPNLSKTTAQVSSNILSKLRGELSPETQNAIRDASATFGIANGIPGSQMVNYRNARDLGLTSQGLQTQGGQEFLNTLGAYSGTIAPTTGQVLQNNQFNADLGFRQNQANRQYGLQQNEQDLAAAKFNEQFGPRLYATNYKMPGGNWETEPGSYWANDRGQKSSNASALLFKYRR